MALPKSIDPTAPVGGTTPALGDDELRALKLAITDILGIPVDPIAIAAAMFTAVAAGLKSVNFQDAAADPAVAGVLQRNALLLKYYDGSAVQTLARLVDIPASFAVNFNVLTGTIALAQITDDLITYAKLQNVSAASKVLGRGSAGGSGDAEELAIGSGLLLSGTTLSAPAQAPISPQVATFAVSVNTGQTTNSLVRPPYFTVNEADQIVCRVSVFGFTGGSGGKGGTPSSSNTVNTDFTINHNVHRVQNVTPSLVITSLANPFTGTLKVAYS